MTIIMQIYLTILVVIGLIAIIGGIIKIVCLNYYNRSAKLEVAGENMLFVGCIMIIAWALFIMLAKIWHWY